MLPPSQAVTAGSGEAAATTWALARPSPSSLSTRWRPGRMPGRPWTSITTRPDARYLWALHFHSSHSTVREAPLAGNVIWFRQVFSNWGDVLFENFGAPSRPSSWLHSIKHLLNHFSFLRITLSVPPKHPIHFTISEVPLVPNNNSVFGVPEGPIYPCWMPLMTRPQLKNLRITGASLIRDPGEPDTAQHSVLCCSLK